MASGGMLSKIFIVFCFFALVYGTFQAKVQKCDNSNGTQKASKLVIPSQFSTTGDPLTFGYGAFDLHQCAVGQLKTIELDISNSAAKNATFQFTPHGFLTFNEKTIDQDLEKKTFSNSNFCVDSNANDTLEVSICLVNCAETPCIPKCCHTQELFDLKTSTCVVGNRQWIPVLYSESSEGYPKVNTLLHVVPKLRFCTPTLEFGQKTRNKHLIFFDEEGEEHIMLRLLANGELEYKLNTETEWKHYATDFCLDGDSASDENVLMDLNCTLSENDVYEDVYEPAVKKAEMGNTLSLVHAILMVVSSFFLLFAILIYVALWEKQNTHGWTVLSYITSLFFAYIFLAISRLKSNTRETNEARRGFGCVLNGILAHFFFESIFTWLTVINFDIWWKFWDLKSHPINARDLTRYLSYVGFGFGIPLIVVLVGIGLGASEIGVDPGYGYGGKCFLQPKAQGYYMYYPVGVLVLLNFALFVSTSFKIAAHFRNTSHVHEEKAQQEFESGKVIIKLFVVMGVTWVFELISFLAEHKTSSVAWDITWGIVDCVNILQAVGIFYVFIWKRLILTQLWQKYPVLRPFLHKLKGMPGCRKRIDYRCSSRLTTKSAKHETASQKEARKERNRKLSDTSERTTSFENIELA